MIDLENDERALFQAARRVDSPLDADKQRNKRAIFVRVGAATTTGSAVMLGSSKAAASGALTLSKAGAGLLGAALTTGALVGAYVSLRHAAPDPVRPTQVSTLTHATRPASEPVANAEVALPDRDFPLHSLFRVFGCDRGTDEIREQGCAAGTKRANTIGAN